MRLSLFKTSVKFQKVIIHHFSTSLNVLWHNSIYLNQTPLDFLFICRQIWFCNVPIYHPQQHKRALNLNKYTPAGLLGTEMTQDVVLWVPGRSWSCVAAPGSQTCTKKNISEKVIKSEVSTAAQIQLFPPEGLVASATRWKLFHWGKIRMMYSFKEGKQTNGVKLNYTSRKCTRALRVTKQRQ